MTEAGTLSIVQRGLCYQVRYASNNVYDPERRPQTCPNETHLAALLHHFGMELAVIAQACADVQHGKMAVLLVGISTEQLQVFFPPTPQAHAWKGAAYPASGAPPGAAIVRRRDRHGVTRSGSMRAKSARKVNNG